MTAPAVICPHCRVGEVLEGMAVCPLCGRAVDKPSGAVAAVPPAIDADVRRELERVFSVDRPIGRGGMSVVYLARELELNRLVAVKILPLHLSMGEDAIERFKREAKVAASLDHPHIVPVHRIGATPRFMWYSMKWVRGRSLQEILRDRGRLDLDETIRILEAVGAALDHAHHRGVVHRDIKPGNVLIDESGWVTVCDFGLAKAFGSLQLTQTGTGVGTPGYMSPEQCFGRQLDGRSDQYALAILAFECLTGSLPFTADSFGEIVRKQCFEPPPRIDTLRDDLAVSVADALHRALSKEPGDRFPDVAALVEALGGQASRTSASVSDPSLAILATPPSEPPSAHRAHRRRHSLATAGLALALVGVATVGLYRFGRGRVPGPSGTDTTFIAGPTATRDSALPAPPATAVGNDFATLVVDSRPPSLVVIDGRRGHFTPVMNLRVAPGKHQIRLEAEGYRPFERTVDLVAGQADTLTHIQLVPVQ